MRYLIRMLTKNFIAFAIILFEVQSYASMVLELPNGYKYYPITDLNKLVIVNTTEKNVKLTNRNHSLLCMIDNIFYFADGEANIFLLPPIQYNDQIYVPEECITALNITATHDRNTILLHTDEKSNIKCLVEKVNPPIHISGIHPVVDFSNQCLIGGIIDKQWKENNEFKSRITGDEIYSLYSLTKRLSSAHGGRIYEPSDEGEGGTGIFIQTDTITNAIGIVGQWNAMPSKITKLNNNNKFYKNEMRKLLSEYSINLSKVNITQLLQADIDNDNIKEILICIETDRPGYNNTVGLQLNDYSAVVIRKFVNGKIITFVPMGMICNKNSKFNDAILPIHFSIIGILDIDGDAIQEILVKMQFTQYQATYIFKYYDNNFWSMITGDMGD